MKITTICGQCGNEFECDEEIADTIEAHCPDCKELEQWAENYG